MLCDVLMKTAVESVSPEDSAETAARRMRDKNIGFLPVCDRYSGKVRGTLTDRDIALRVVAEKRSLTTPVQQIMTRDAIYCRPDDDISTAEELMADNLVSRIMCIDEDGQLVGVISLSDIAVMDGARAARTLEQVSAREARLYVPLTPPVAHR